MSVYDELTEAAAEPKRDKFGRYVIIPATGGKAKSYTRATTVAETLDDRYNLELWKMRQVAVGLARRPDILAGVATADAEDKKAINALCQDAMSAADSGAAANMGTALHKVIERINTGEQHRDDVPEMFRHAAHAYCELLESHRVTVLPEACERIHVLDAHGIAGMADCHVTIDGRRYIADLKTGTGVDFGARGFAVQLAIYAMAETLYDPGTETHTAMPEVDQDRALIIHLPAKGGDPALHWLDIGAGREALIHALWTRQWRKNKALLTPVAAVEATAAPPVSVNTKVHQMVHGPDAGPPSAPADGVTRAWITERIMALDSAARSDLAARWPDGVPTLKASTDHSDEQIDLIATALWHVETEHEAQFAPTDPRVGDAQTAETRIDAEGGAADPAIVGKLQASLAALGAEPVARIRQWTIEANEAGHSISLRARRTLRRQRIAAAAIDLAFVVTDDDVVRTIVGLVLGEELQPAVTIGAALGALDHLTAPKVSAIVAAISEGTLTVDGSTVNGVALAGIVGAAV